MKIKYLCWDPSLGRAERVGVEIESTRAQYAAESFAEDRFDCDACQEVRTVVVRDSTGIERRFRVRAEPALSFHAVEVDEFGERV